MSRRPHALVAAGRLTEMLDVARRICRAVDIALVVDGDTGGGGILIFAACSSASTTDLPATIFAESTSYTPGTVRRTCSVSWTN